jgi:hypothetical protein
MPLRRRDRKTPNPPEEREMPRRRGRQLPEPPGAREMCEMRARIDAMEIHRGMQSVLEISVSLKVKMKLDMEMKKLQQKNAYSGLLQG